MGQQQLLLLVLGIVMVGLAVVVGVSAFNENQRKFRQDQTANLMVDLASKAQAWKMTAETMGGGAGSAENDFSEFTLGDIGLQPTGTQGAREIILRTEYTCLKLFPQSNRLRINALDTECSNGSWWYRVEVTGIDDEDITTRMNASNANGNGQ
ncbi:hypothetical protein [Rubrivirga sp.]|uniref:hypothetical protein n=1 Tax=Rubrivirga sp. TaxID=1885344 RepID=UPI003C75B372